LLTLHWLLTAVALVVAVVALARARRTAKRLERLTETYWELRYDHGQLRARVAKLDAEGTAPPAQADAAPKPGSNFVPLSSLKR
jgi:hypothetical protein